MAQDNSHLIIAEPEQDWLIPTREKAADEMRESIILSAFDIDDTPLTPAVEVKACIILNPNGEVCN